MIKDLIQEIETGDLRHDLAFASTPRSLMQRINNSNVVQKIQKQFGFDPQASQTIFKRAKEIYFGPIEKGYLHPDDFMLATYIFLLGRNAMPSVKSFIRTVASGQYPEFRNATGVAKIVVKRMPEATMQTVTVKPWQPFVVSSPPRRATTGQQIPDFPSISLATTEDVQRYYQASVGGRCVEVA